jgi:hypothetical protein
MTAAGLMFVFIDNVVAVLLDPSFQPGRSNTGSKQFPFFADSIELQLLDTEDNEDNLDNLAMCSAHAKEIIMFVGEILGEEPVSNYLTRFFLRHIRKNPL